MRTRYFRTGGSAVVVCLVLLATACSAASRSGNGKPNLHPVTAVVDSWVSGSADQGPFQPLLDGAKTVEQRLRPRYTQEISSCMAARGFVWDAGSSSSSPVVRNTYSVISDAERSAGSYAVPDTTAPQDPNVAYLASLTQADRKAWSVALTGAGQRAQTFHLPSGAEFFYVPGSCAIAAAQKVYGRSFQLDLASVQDLGNQVARQTLDDGRVVAAVGAWASCVAAHGDGPVTALGDLRSRALAEGVAAGVAAKYFQVDLECEDLVAVRTVLTSVQTENEKEAAVREVAPLAQLAHDLDVDGGAAAG